jgi:protein associated with RNAse G/E
VNSYWNSGDQVVRRGVVGNRVWIAHPVTVVQDTLAQTILLLTPGSLCKFSAGLIERKYAGNNAVTLSRWGEQDAGQWQLVDWVWRQRRFLIFMEPDAYFSTALVWEHDTDEFLGWYVNFERPFTRTPLGFDTLDLEVDLMVQPDGAWRWKDEAEYREGVRRGSISSAVAQQVEQARVEALHRVQSAASPFDTSWQAWRPEPAWPIPQLPANWAQVVERP